MRAFCALMILMAVIAAIHHAFRGDWLTVIVFMTFGGIWGFLGRISAGER